MFKRPFVCCPAEADLIGPSLSVSLSVTFICSNRCPDLCSAPYFKCTFSEYCALTTVLMSKLTNPSLHLSRVSQCVSRHIHHPQPHPEDNN